MKMVIKAAAVFAIAFGLGILSATFLQLRAMIILSSLMVIILGLLIIRS